MLEGRASTPPSEQQWQRRALSLSPHQSGLLGLSWGLFAEMLGSLPMTFQGEGTVPVSMRAAGGPGALGKDPAA